MISIDYELFLKIVFAFYFLTGISKIILGVGEVKKDDHYTVFDAIDGLIAVCVVIIVAVW